MSEVIRYLASYTPYEGLDLNGQCARHDGDYFVSAVDFDLVTAERDALQQRLTAADERAAELLIMLRMAWIDTEVSADNCRRIDAALKPAEGRGDATS